MEHKYSASINSDYCQNIYYIHTKTGHKFIYIHTHTGKRISCVYRNWVSTASVFTGAPARPRASCWPLATTRQHRKFHAVNDQHHLAIRLVSWKQKCPPYRESPFLNFRGSFSYAKKKKSSKSYQHAFVS
jgi:hypothetical protein